jgi:hypothetical protein
MLAQRKKEKAPVVVPVTGPTPEEKLQALQEQLAVAVAEVEKCDSNIQAHDAVHQEFIKTKQIMTGPDGIDPSFNPQCPPSMDENVSPVEIMEEFQSWQLKKNHLVYEFSRALKAWSDLKMAVVAQQGAQ